jgi:hypothetical protein
MPNEWMNECMTAQLQKPNATDTWTSATATAKQI